MRMCTKMLHISILFWTSGVAGAKPLPSVAVAVDDRGMVRTYRPSQAPALVARDGRQDIAQAHPPLRHVAVLIRGETFRAGRTHGAACHDHQKLEQLKQARSLVDYVLRPLEQIHKSSVDLIVHMQECSMNEELIHAYDSPSHDGDRRVKLHREKNYPHQSAGFRGALDLFQEFLGNRSVTASDYDLIIITRHDMVYKAPFTSLELGAHWSHLKFLSRCEHGAPAFFGDCVSDVMQTMPGSLFEKFDQTIGTGLACFQTDCQNTGEDNGHGGCKQDNGHGCKLPMESNGIHISFLTGWIPSRKLHLRDQSNPFSNIGSV